MLDARLRIGNNRRARSGGAASVRRLNARGSRQQTLVDWAPAAALEEEIAMSLGTILIIVLILILIGALPTWGYSSGWGYGPGGIVGLILIIVIVLALMGRI